MKIFIFSLVVVFSSLSFAGDDPVPAGYFTFHSIVSIGDKVYIYQPSYQTGSYPGYALIEATDLVRTGQGLCVKFGYKKLYDVRTTSSQVLPTVLVEGHSTGVVATGLRQSARYIFKLICQ